MVIQKRLRTWVCLAMFYMFFMLVIQFLGIPFRSNASHPHFDISSDTIIVKPKLTALNQAQEKSQSALDVKNNQNEENQQIKVLSDVFNKADINKDDFLDMSELSTWVGTKIKEHLSLALRENFFMFMAVDKDPKNGVVTWDEYHSYLLKQLNYDDEYIKKHKDNHKGMPRELKEAIMRDKAAWSQAYRDNPNQLSIDEFLAFRHPESSHATILSLAEDTLTKLDLNGDGTLDEEEFSDPIMNEVPDYLTGDQFKKGKIQEFRNVIDKNKNGKVEKRELLFYIDPRNNYHAAREALNLLNIGDANHDNFLTLEEILQRKDIYIISKLVDAATSFHDEF